jgi:anion-transporting  ArsA/GET3 family ATPase
MDARELLRARLLVVTGKGGTGKTSVAAALAVAAAAKGHEVLLAEVEGRQGLARLFDLPALGHEEAPIGERLTGLAIDPRAALREYLDGAGVPVLGTLLDRAGLGDLVTAAAPGLGDVLLAGKLAQVARRSMYDLVVLDAPPSGRIVPFLGAAAGLAGLARFGPVADQAGGVAELLTDPALTQVVVTTLPEALPVTEALQTAAALRAASPLGVTGCRRWPPTRPRCGRPPGRPASSSATPTWPPWPARGCAASGAWTPSAASSPGSGTGWGST